jgi:hypothetical protein
MILEILYFAPRYPLSVFFGPIIKTLYAEVFLHYPFYFYLLPKFIRYAQILVYLFLGGYLIGIAIFLIGEVVNNNRTVSFSAVLKKNLSWYLHIFMATFLSFCFYFMLESVYALLMKRALLIQSTAGQWFFLKKIVLEGAPYANLLFSILTTTVFAFVIPMIVLEHKKFFAALVANFQLLWPSFHRIFIIILVPAFLYLPVLLFRNNVAIFADTILPEMHVGVIVLGIIILMIIDSITYTAITTYYFLKKNN